MKSDCIPNIGPNERRRRQRIGFVSLVCAVAIAAALLVSDVPRAWRILVFLPLLLAAVAFLQVRAGTCVVLAARGVRNLDAGDEVIADRSELEAIKAQARRINLQAPLVAAVITAALLAVP